jgi:septal ring factor EnvC (AmiA/AmiB activator)
VCASLVGDREPSPGASARATIDLDDRRVAATDQRAVLAGGLRRLILSGGHSVLPASPASEHAFDDRFDLVAIHLRRKRAFDPGHGRADLAELAADTSELAADTSELAADASELTADVSELTAETSELTADVSELTADLSDRAAVLEDCELHLTESAVDSLEPVIYLLELLGDLVAKALESLAEDAELRIQIFEDDDERSVAAGGLRRSSLSGDHSFSSH